MMTPSDIENEDFDVKSSNANSAILEVSSIASGTIVKQDSRDLDHVNCNSNYSTSVDGSMIASPSIDSFSTIPDQETSDFPDDNKDLQVKVDNPQKHLETLETYITFRITTRTTRAEFEDNEYVVQRRYNDFIWLRQKLVDLYPSHIIPPMPGKHSLLGQLDRYSKEFIIARMKQLHRFLNRIVNHPILSYDREFRAFLTAKPTEFSVIRKNRGNGLVKHTDSLQNLTGTYSIKNRNLEFERIRDYCNSLNDKLNHIDKINCRIYRERQDYITELQQFYPIFNQWSLSEPELSSLLTSISKVIETNVSSNQKLNENISNDEREYVAYVESVKDALNRRDTMQIEYELTSDELLKRRSERDQLVELANGTTRSQSWSGSIWKSETRDEKLERLTQTVPRLAKRTEVLQDRLECANENLRSDIDRWTIEKQSDIKNMLITMADRQIKHYQNCMNNWDELLSGLKCSDTSSADVQNINKISV